MMAITIRDTESHLEMLDQLKTLTDKNTSSGALIKGGYQAIRFERLYCSQIEKNRELERELRDLKNKVRCYLSSIDGLRDAV